MTDRSIRSFALDYYRKRGDEVQALEGQEGEAYAITPKAGAALKITFADDVAPAHDGPAALTAMSPQFRAILEDLTAEIAVSYRYLVSKPISNPAATLRLALPEGWDVTKARLLMAANLAAVGFTHRVTFDSPALNARREVMHHHLWDVATGQRLSALEAALYDAPTLMIRPENAPGEAVIKGFLDRSLAIVDLDTDARGRLIESELKDLLGEAETRANQYYEQQMGQVLAREAQLAEKLEAVGKRLAEARTPEQIAKLRQDAGSLQNQLEHLRQSREANLAAIEAACGRKLATERERHELTAMTDLVAICHVSYDVLTYRATVAPPGGEAVEMDLRYWPVSKELQLPDCPSCRGPMTEPRALATGGIACVRCVSACPACHAVDETPGAARACARCEAAICRGCETTCGTCGGASCAEHAVACSACEMALCARCDTACTTCGAAICRTHAHVDPLSGHLHCRDHRPIDLAEAPPAILLVDRPAPVLPPANADQPQEAEAAEAEATEAEAVEAEEAPAPRRGWLSGLARAFRPSPQLPVLPTPIAYDAELPEDEPVAAPAAVVFAAAVEGEAVAPAFVMDEADLPDLGVLAPAAPVHSSLTGEAIHPRLAETCPACGDHFAVQEMVDCGTCGVPACRRCASGDLAPCPACESLQVTVVTDPRLAFVLQTYPDLAARRRTWEVAHVGPYVVTHWSRFGAWGMVVYHKGGADRTPVVVTDFAYGRASALAQALTLGRWRP